MYLAARIVLLVSLALRELGSFGQILCGSIHFVCALPRGRLLIKRIIPTRA
jgi:hypothetical protein